MYDLGGGTFDVTLVRYTPTHFQVLATDGDVQLGGVDWNDRILEHVAKEFQARHNLDIRSSPATLQMLRHDCDQAKVALSEDQQASIICRHGGKSLSVTITREQFEDMTADLLQRTIDTTEQVLEQAKVEPGQLDAIVLVGGSTLMPKVPQLLEQATGIKPYQGISPHTSVAQGAAIHAAILEAKYRGDKSELGEKVRKYLKQIKQEDVNSHGLGVAVKHPRHWQDDQSPDDPPQHPAARREQADVSHQCPGAAARDGEGDRRGCARSRCLYIDRQLQHHELA